MQLRTGNHGRGVGRRAPETMRMLIQLDINQLCKVIWPRLGLSILQWSSREPKLTSCDVDATQLSSLVASASEVLIGYTTPQTWSSHDVTTRTSLTSVNTQSVSSPAWRRWSLDAFTADLSTSDLPWIYILSSISISTDYPWISMDISISTDAYPAYVQPQNFHKIQQRKRLKASVLPPLKNTTQTLFS